MLIWENDWTPCNLLEKVTLSKWHEYDKPDISLFGTTYGELLDYTERTIFGNFIDKLPAIISLLFLIVYYPVMSILYCVVFFTIDILKTILGLFTKKWSDFF